MALHPTLHEIEDRPTLSAHALECIRRRVERVRRAPLPARLVAVYLWLRRSLLRALALRLAVVARPYPGGRLRYLPRAIRRRLYARITRVTRDRACALTRLARLSQAVGVSDPSQL